MKRFLCRCWLWLRGCRCRLDCHEICMTCSPDWYKRYKPDPSVYGEEVPND